MKHIYLDYAATTPTRVEVLRKMLPFFDRKYGNPSSFHQIGKEAKDAIDSSREKIAKILACRGSEIIFTSGGTESDNLALFGAARANRERGNHLITSQIEHPAVLESCLRLEKEGFAVTYLPVDKEGVVLLDALENALRRETILVSIMYANNEIGTIQPIREIAKILRDKTDRKKTGYPYFHTDACQAAGALDLNVLKLDVDLLTFNGSKIYGPKGTGALYLKRGVKIEPVIYGGGQERKLRSGTENVPAIVGLAEALELAQNEKDKEGARLVKLRDYFIREILKKFPASRLNGHQHQRLPNNINVCLSKVEGEATILYLDSYGIYAATGSACNSRSLLPSHVLLALGLPREIIHSSLRFTLGRTTTKKDLDYVLEVLPEVVKKLTEVSSL